MRHTLHAYSSLRGSRFLTNAVMASTQSVEAVRHAPQVTHIVQLLSDDQGWGEVEWRDPEKRLRTPNLAAMAANGLRLERYYSGSPVCSPARAALLTGRAPHRTGVDNQGMPLRLQEKTVAHALQRAGWHCAHFGKMHLEGIHSLGIGGGPTLGNYSHRPSAFGFETWISNYGVFDLDPLLSREGEIAAFRGEGSEVIVREALNFIRREAKGPYPKPLFVAVHYASPHDPWYAHTADQALFRDLIRCEKYKTPKACVPTRVKGRFAAPVWPRDCDCFLEHHVVRYYAELHALDRSVGTMRKGLRELGIENRTILWFSSDNGGPKLSADVL